MTFAPCGKVIRAEVPGTGISVGLVCKFAAGHPGHHIAKGTMDGVEFEVEFERQNTFYGSRGTN